MRITKVSKKKKLIVETQLTKKLGLNFAVLRLKMCQCMNTSIRNAIPS